MLFQQPTRRRRLQLLRPPRPSKVMRRRQLAKKRRHLPDLEDSEFGVLASLEAVEDSTKLKAND